MAIPGTRLSFAAVGALSGLALGFLLGRSTSTATETVEVVVDDDRDSGGLDGAGEARRGAPSPSARVEDGEPKPALTAAPAPPGGPGRPATTPPPTPSPAPRPAGPSPREVASARAVEWKKKIHQIDSPTLREDGLRELEDALASADPHLASAAASTLGSLRNIPHDPERFRPILRRQMASADPGVRTGAAHGLAAVGAAPGDLDLVLEAASRAEPPHLVQLLQAAARLQGGLIDGPVADAYVKALSTLPPRDARDVAHSLRGWNSSERVHQAVVDAFRRELRAGEIHSIWSLILGQLRPPSETSVRAAFDLLLTQPPHVHKDVTERLEQRLEEPVRSLAAGLAAQSLGKTTESSIHHALLRVLRAHGSSAEVETIETFAANEMVLLGTREEARSVVQAIRSARR